MINVPQIKSVATILVSIVVVSLCAGIWTAFVHGEVHSWMNLVKAANDGLLYAVLMAVGWIGLKSPFAKSVAGLLQQETTKVTEMPGGKVVTEKIKTSVEVATPTEEVPASSTGDSKG